ncbi:MAG: AMP-binding protein [Gammaproteobacteria bacterium]|jgi:long-chain acyl-CoA synthetase|nr:AMP-binding protein [Gammaproteobacteria bacterium]
MGGETYADRESALAEGMAVAYHAARRPDNLALATAHGDRSFRELNARANQLARLLARHGIGGPGREGDAIAVVTRNRPEFVEAYCAALRSGIRVTPVNWHLSGAETGYIIDNCEARAVIYDASLGTAEAAAAHAADCHLRLAVGGSIPGFEDYDAAIAAEDPADVEHPVRGSQMLYTSGTTGRPKGVFRRQLPAQRSAAQSLAAGDPDEDRCLCTGPAYHAAPLAFNVTIPLHAGVGVVMMDRWDPEQTLALIERYRITHTHMVATMFHRLLQLPEAVKRKYDLSSLKLVMHGAAPCPVHVKRAIIDWFGPIVYEYYAATEGGNNFGIDSATWLKKPGSVGTTPTPENTRILDDAGNDVAQGEVGTIYFRAPEVGRFEYFKAPEKTDSSYRGDWFTLGDMGYLDEDGFLFLTGRSAETIISGGVNIYPQEIDAALLQHPQVLDVCTVGVPNDEWGEEVKAVVLAKPEAEPGAALAEDIMAFARDQLAGFKCPRSVDFAADLPRLPSGKIQRRLVRQPYWEGRDKQI